MTGADVAHAAGRMEGRLRALDEVLMELREAPPAERLPNEYRRRAAEAAARVRARGPADRARDDGTTRGVADMEVKGVADVEDRAAAGPAEAMAMPEDGAAGPDPGPERYWVPILSVLEIKPQPRGRWDLLEGGSTVGHYGSLDEARKAAYARALEALETQISNAKHRIAVCQQTLGALGRNDPFFLGRFREW